MQKQRYKRWLCLLVILCGALAHADVRMPFTFNSGMVLQHGVEQPIWGMANPGEEVIVKFAGQELKTVADATGEWSVKLTSLASSAQPQEMLISGQNKLKFSNVLVGEVWLGIGTNVMGGNNRLKIPSIKTAQFVDSLLRCHTLPNANAILPVAQNFYPSMWFDASERRLNNWPAIPYYFLKERRAAADMPVAILNGSFARGGEPEMYMPYVSHQFFPSDTFPMLAAELAALDITCEAGRKTFTDMTDAFDAWQQDFATALAAGDYPPPRPTFPGETEPSCAPATIYNAMINPVKHFPVTGVVVFLQKTYAGRPEDYYVKMAALIDGIRADFARPQLPVIIVDAIDSDAGELSKVAASRQNVVRISGVGSKGWQDILPSDTVGQALAAAAAQLLESANTKE